MFSDQRSHRAHRWLFQYLNGPIPDGKVLDHLCRTTSCVNPNHLEVVDNQENLERGWGRRIKTGWVNFCINGHEYTSDNTYKNPLGRLVCRTCSAQSRLRYQERKKQSVGK
ncbi:HNH endonuclease signature motif containing protein [Timonella sp. A28]|uniref:HNH endonuclease signature motif containing protein n=1 Tax=Timonella sp. A28 TaxID=3442640 RepID=UPI003EC039AF